MSSKRKFPLIARSSREVSVLQWFFAIWCGKLLRKGQVSLPLMMQLWLRSLQPFISFALWQIPGPALATWMVLYYWRSRKGKEMDFVYYPDQEGKPFGVEVKYQGRISGCDEQSITKGIDRGILVTRNDFKWAGYVRFRYGLFCPYLSDSAKNALSAG